MTLYKLSLEVGHRVLSHSSRDFCDGAASSLQRAATVTPSILEWITKLQTRIDRRSTLPLQDSGLPPRFHRVCETYDFSPIERRLFAALFIQASDDHSVHTTRMVLHFGVSE